MDKRILFIINGLGLGNSSRCEGVIDSLEKLGVEVDIITSGNGYHYFKQNRKLKKIYKFKQIKYGKNKSGQLSVLNTIFSFPKLLFIYFKNVKLLKSVLSEKPYSAVVYDSDYTIAFFKRFLNGPVIGINNASDVLKFSEGYPRSTWPQLIIEILDDLYFKIVSDLILCPSLSCKGEGVRKGKTKRIAPLIRQDLEWKAQAESPKKVLVMLSGSQFETDLRFLEVLEEKRYEIQVIGGHKNGANTNYELSRVYDNRDLIKNCDLLIINCGLSAISEASVLGIPALVIPISNHAEQYYNARVFEKLGYGIASIDGRHEENLLKLIKNYKSFLSKEKRYEKSGAQIASNLILEKINELQS